MVERVFTPDEAAEYLSLSPKTIREWLREEKLKGVKIGRVWRIRESDLQGLLDETALMQEKATPLTTLTASGDFLQQVARVQSLTLYPVPSAEVTAQVDEADADLGELKGNDYLRFVQDFKKLLGLDPEKALTRKRKGSFDYEHEGRTYRVSVELEPTPHGEAMRINIQPLEEKE